MSNLGTSAEEGGAGPSFSCLSQVADTFFQWQHYFKQHLVQALISSPPVPTRPSGLSVTVALWQTRWGK